MRTGPIPGVFAIWQGDDPAEVLVPERTAVHPASCTCDVCFEGVDKSCYAPGYCRCDECWTPEEQAAWDAEWAAAR